MKKGLVFSIITILILCLGIGIGVYIYNKNIIKNTKIQDLSETVISDDGIEGECTQLAEANNLKSMENEDVKQTNGTEEKVSPNATLIIKKRYSDCGHTIKNSSEIPQEMVNLTKLDIEKRFPEWQVLGFSSKEVVIYKEMEGMCNEHYVLKQKDGYIAVFKTNETGEELLQEITGIATEYLTEGDLQKIKSGIKAVGQEELNSILEDFE